MQQTSAIDKTVVGFLFFNSLNEVRLFNECAIIYKEKGVLQTRRPDRVMMKDGQVVVVDFKFGLFWNINRERLVGEMFA